jgi:hypothetical protein
MRDINYGFAALEHRLRVLGGDPYVISDERKIDLARLLVSRYGTKYINHPRLQQLMAKNHIKPVDFLDGPGEAAAFDGKEYVKLHQSTLRKVDVLSNIVERTYNGSLKTNATIWDLHGGSLRAVGEHLKNHWAVALIGLIAAMITIGAAIAALRF